MKYAYILGIVQSLLIFHSIKSLFVYVVKNNVDRKIPTEIAANSLRMHNIRNNIHLLPTLRLSLII